MLWRDPGNYSYTAIFTTAPARKSWRRRHRFASSKEVKEGGMPKFDVEDARGVKWRVKLGPEAQSETVSSRLLWAVGYNAEECLLLRSRQHRRTETPIAWPEVHRWPVGSRRSL